MHQQQATRRFEMGGAWFDAATPMPPMFGYPVDASVRGMRTARRRPGWSAGRPGPLRALAPVLAMARWGVRS